jgi:hypothetical protein
LRPVFGKLSQLVRRLLRIAKVASTLRARSEGEPK